jgi:protein-arginine kinase
MTQEEKDKLKDFNICLSDDEFSTTYNLMQDWPEGRAVYYNDSLTFVLKVNFEDHLEIYMNSTSTINEHFKNLF